MYFFSELINYIFKMSENRAYAYHKFPEPKMMFHIVHFVQYQSTVQNKKIFY